MSRRRSTHWAGFTLIEVLAGLALLGTLLVGLVLARRNLIDQQRRAEKTLVAIDLAEALLNSWIAQAEGGSYWLASIPREDRGDVSTTLEESGGGLGGDALRRGRWMWRTRYEALPRQSQLDGIGMVRFDLFDGGSPESSEPVTTVELLVPAAQPAPASRGRLP